MEEVPHQFAYETLTTESSLSMTSSNISVRFTTDATYQRKLSNLAIWRASIFGIGGTIVCCVGIVCNLTAILVLAHFKGKSSAPVLLICLAISDSLYLLTVMFFETIPSLAFARYIGNDYRNNLMPSFCALYPVPLVAQCISIYLVVTITLERYTVVVWPFHAQKICNTRTAITAVVCLAVVVILYHTPVYLAYRCYDGWNSVTRTNITNFVRTEFGMSHFYIQVYYKWINPVVTFALPFLILLLFNALMLRALRRDRNVSCSSAQNRWKQERRMGVMVMSMTSVFFLFELMSAVAFVLTTGADDYIQISEHLSRYTVVSNLGLLVNSAINLAIYCCTGKRFRDTFRHIVRTYPHRLGASLTCRKPPSDRVNEGVSRFTSTFDVSRTSSTYSIHNIKAGNYKLAKAKPASSNSRYSPQVGETERINRIDRE